MTTPRIPSAAEIYAKLNARETANKNALQLFRDEFCDKYLDDMTMELAESIHRNCTSVYDLQTGGFPAATSLVVPSALSTSLKVKEVVEVMVKQHLVPRLSEVGWTYTNMIVHGSPPVVSITFTDMKQAV